MFWPIFWLIFSIVVLIIAFIFLNKVDSCLVIVIVFMAAFGVIFAAINLLNCLADKYYEKVIPLEEPKVTVQEYALFQIVTSNKLEGAVDGEGNILHSEIEGNVSTDIAVTVFYYTNGNQTSQKNFQLSELDFVIVENEEEEKYVVKKEVYYEEDQNKSPVVIREKETHVYYIVYITEENFSKYITGG